jgi:cyclopropane-fatty-acyl-phospholipid synthase
MPLSSHASLSRSLAFVPEMLFYGFNFAQNGYLVRSPEPLDPEETWNAINHQPSRALRWFRDNYPLRSVRRLSRALIYRHSPTFKNHRLGIDRHYQRSVDFFKLFLDRKYMFYSCADFEKPGDTLEDAQENKANYLVRLIDPKPGERILDLGCGWGAMLKKISEVTGDRENIEGWTLSSEQIRFIRQELGLRVEDKNFCTEPIAERSFDKIYSIGSMEHVREHELLPLARTLRRALRSGGRIVHHFFTGTDELPHPTTIFAGFHFFPGSELVSLARHLRIFEQAGLRLVHHSLHDYRPTLRAWFDRLVENREEAIRLEGVHCYNTFLVFFSVSHLSFQERTLLVNRFVLEEME